MDLEECRHCLKHALLREETLKAKNERLKAERQGMIHDNPGHAYWQTAPRDELLEALLFQGGTTKALLQQTAEQIAEIKRLREEIERWKDRYQIISQQEQSVYTDLEECRSVSAHWHESYTSRGSRMQKMREWFHHIGGDREWWYFCKEHPEATKWFDADGMPVDDAALRGEGE